VLCAFKQEQKSKRYIKFTDTDASVRIIYFDNDLCVIKYLLAMKIKIPLWKYFWFLDDGGGGGGGTAGCNMSVITLMTSAT
jgi:hypothetical protein